MIKKISQMIQKHATTYWPKHKNDFCNRYINMKKVKIDLRRCDMSAY